MSRLAIVAFLVSSSPAWAQRLDLTPLASYTTPADIYTQFVSKFGRKALFPVAQTELGGIGLITCGELAYPEFSRCTMMNGAEVLLYHLKPAFVSQLKRELAGLPVEILELGDTFEF